MNSPFARLTTVLVRPIYARNTGMCSRSIGNMGAGRLILIAPHFDPHSHDAREGAAGGQRALQDAKVYESLEEFYEHEGEGTRIALTARDNRLRTPEPLDEKLESLLCAEETILTEQKKKIDELRRDFAGQEGQFDSAQEPRALFNPNSPIYLFFGPEDDGLSFNDMKLVHHLCSLPVAGDFKSLNLSHAVLLTLHIVTSFLKRIDKGVKIPIEPPAAPEKVYYPEKTIDAWLEALGFSLDHRRVNVALTLHRLLLDHQPRPNDLRILESVLQQNIRKLRE